MKVKKACRLLVDCFLQSSLGRTTRRVIAYPSCRSFILYEAICKTLPRLSGLRDLVMGGWTFGILQSLKEFLEFWKEQAYPTLKLG
jgi:hypothetical protein